MDYSGMCSCQFTSGSAGSTRRYTAGKNLGFKLCLLLPIDMAFSLRSLCLSIQFHDIFTSIFHQWLSQITLLSIWEAFSTQGCETQNILFFSGNGWCSCRGTSLEFPQLFFILLRQRTTSHFKWNLYFKYQHCSHLETHANTLLGANLKISRIQEFKS